MLRGSEKLGRSVFIRNKEANNNNHNGIFPSAFGIFPAWKKKDIYFIIVIGKDLIYLYRFHNPL